MASIRQRMYARRIGRCIYALVRCETSSTSLGDWQQSWELRAKLALQLVAKSTRATGRTRTSAKHRPVRRAGGCLPSPRAGSTSSACSRGSTTRPSSATARRLTQVPLPHPSPYKYQRSWILESALFPAGISDGVASSATSSATPLQPARNFGSRSRGAPSGLVVLLCGRNGSAGAILSPSPGPPLTSEHWHRDGLLRDVEGKRQRQN